MHSIQYDTPFCCNGVTTTNPDGETCSNFILWLFLSLSKLTLISGYPICDSGCKEAETCSCPFSLDSAEEPFWDFMNTTCTCELGYDGLLCETYGIYSIHNS